MLEGYLTFEEFAPMSIDPEMIALSEICAAFEKVPNSQARERIFRYLLERYGKTFGFVNTTNTIDVTPRPTSHVALLSEDATPKPTKKTSNGKVRSERSSVPDVAPCDLGTINQIISTLGAKTNPEIILAAAARLSIGLNKEVFSRNEIRVEIQAAVGHYDMNLGKNLSYYLKTLRTSNKISERHTNQYSLTADTRKELVEKLGR